MKDMKTNQETEQKTTLGQHKQQHSYLNKAQIKLPIKDHKAFRQLVRRKMNTLYIDN